MKPDSYFESSPSPSISAAQNLRFGEALSRYEQLVTPDKKSCREERSTISIIRRTAPDLLEMPMTDIRPHHIARYRDRRRMVATEFQLRSGKIFQKSSPPKAATIRKDLCVISDVFRKAQFEWGHDDLVNPVLNGLRPKPFRPRVRRLDDQEFCRLLEAASLYEAHPVSTVPITAIIVFAAHSAMRLSELAGLRWQDIDFNRATAMLHDTKNGEARTVPLKPICLDLLRARKSREVGLVWNSDKEGIRTAWNRVAKRAGIENLRFHDLRHEAISELIENADRYRLSLPEVMFIAGHRSMAMVTRYYHALAPKIAKKLALASVGHRSEA